ncbi:CDP-alcohol phosphatidyltransferase family protein [Alicyclobacillaceae bacterium I2511]|nr:CDP-alcohol phosphatidyltransferase family protein [Alicyclobacillaceae bacterium I2511]
MNSDFAKIHASAKRPTDIWTNHLYYSFSLRLVYLVRNTWVTPNILTLAALALVLLGSLCYATGVRSVVLIGLILVQVSYVFDCADGQLARYRQHFSALGGWLDQTADRIKEFVMYFSLAYGYTRFHPGDTHIWMWAMFALFSLYLLEYFGQIKLIRGPAADRWAAAAANQAHPSPATESSVPQSFEGTKPNIEADSRLFERIQRWRSLIPFRAFIIGEQYFTMLIFVAFNWIYPLFVFVSLLGLAMAIYRPIIDYLKFRRQTAGQPPKRSF